jgi:4-amino-4-deoxy-L-arabinose transferase-like glycosyltransferase
VAALLALDPTLRSHGALVENDVLVSLFLLASAYFLRLSSRSERHGSGLLLGAGLLYGLALVSKFSAAPFLIPFLVVAAVALRATSRATGPALVARLSLLFVLPALLVLGLVQEAAYGGASRAEVRESTIHQFRMLQSAGHPETLVDTLPKGIATYALGLKWVRSRAVPGKWCNYFFGEASGKGSFLYFAVALAVKLLTATALGFFALAIASLATLTRAVPLRRRRLIRAGAGRAFVPGTLGVSFLVLSSLSNVNIGLRHALPCLPLLLVAAAGVAFTLLRRSPRVFKVAISGVVLLSLVEASLRAGHEISFGNLLVGGPVGLRRVLSDSNVDWGQEQNLLFDRVRKGDLGRVGVVSLTVDAEEAKRSGVKWFSSVQEASDLDSVFVSVFFADLGHALVRNHEPYPRLAYTRTWLTPLILGLEQRSKRIEPFGDCYLLLRLRSHPNAPPSS